MITTDLDKLNKQYQKKKNTYIDRRCPFQQEPTFCGDWCPLCSIGERDGALVARIYCGFEKVLVD